jgi:hypothetical protein
MNFRTKLQAGLLLALLAGLLAASELKGAPHVAVQSPTGLYLLAQYKLAVGDTSSGLELLERALGGQSPLPSAGTLNACNIAVRTPSP